MPENFHAVWPIVYVPLALLAPALAPGVILPSLGFANDVVPCLVRSEISNVDLQTDETISAVRSPFHQELVRLDHSVEGYGGLSVCDQRWKAAVWHQDFGNLEVCKPSASTPTVLRR